jgi:hypothetical protein
MVTDTGFGLEFHEVKLRKAKPLRGLARTRTALAKARAHWHNMGAFIGASAMSHLLINSLPARRPAVRPLRFLQSKNLQLTNGMDAVFPGVSRSETP